MARASSTVVGSLPQGAETNRREHDQGEPITVSKKDLLAALRLEPPSGEASRRLHQAILTIGEMMYDGANARRILEFLPSAFILIRALSYLRQKGVGNVRPQEEEGDGASLEEPENPGSAPLWISQQA